MKARKKPGGLTRRQFMAAGAMAGAAWAAGCSSHSGPWESLSDEQARTLAVLCDEIVPADDYPSASQAGVVTYIDRQLARAYRRHRKTYWSGLEQVESHSDNHFGLRGSQASPDERLEMMRVLAKRNPVFFELVRKHTLEGYYGSPRHGGNRDAVSWKMLGLSEPPLRGRAQYDLTKQNGLTTKDESTKKARS
jgi:gluconate 2-dehydrogenase gamma chain